MKWENLPSQARVYFYWEYCANIADEDEAISFPEFDEMMTGYYF